MNLFAHKDIVLYLFGKSFFNEMIYQILICFNVFWNGACDLHVIRGHPLITSIKFKNK